MMTTQDDSLHEMLGRFINRVETFMDEQREFNAAQRESNAAQQGFNAAQQEFNTEQREFNAAQQEFNAEQREFNAAQQEFNAEQRESNAAQQGFNAAQQEFNAEQREFNADTRERLQTMGNDLGVVKGGYARTEILRKASVIARDMGYVYIKNLRRTQILAIADQASFADIDEATLDSFRNADLVIEAEDANHQRKLHRGRSVLHSAGQRCRTGEAQRQVAA